MVFLLLQMIIHSLAFAECDRSQIATYIGQIQKYSERNGISGHIDELESYLKDCKISKRSLGVPDDFFQNLKSENQKYMLKETKKSIEEFTKTGKPDLFKDEYDFYTKNLKTVNAGKYWDEQVKKSEPAYLREKKTCTNVDFSKEMGPIRNQDSVGWCWAFTSADLLSYKTKQRISAADIAYTVKYDHEKIGKDVSDLVGKGTHVHNALNAMAKSGLCPESSIPSEDNVNSEYIELLTKLQKMGSIGIATPEALDCSSTLLSVKTLFPNLSPNEMAAVVQKSKSTNLIKNLANASCKKRFHIKYETWIAQKDADNPMELMDSIDQQLSNKNPVAITYDASGLINRRDFEEYKSHASNLVGRRFNEKTGQCEYLLRNSWGRSCDQYDFHYSCKEGNVWVPKTDLIKRTVLATYVK
ncbi:C1 family peptidase [Bdellovibrio sp. HCB290]|uniref:C1 family peptidase n=1 Tax=Bdellovibrio sp. HCB290 TaxID=3394356 RepID=UPI0039B66F8B